jgi:hypothetical protein
MLTRSLLMFLLLASIARGADPRIATDDAFPDASSGKPLAGELILVEHVNRVGILRLDRDGTISKYHWDLPHHFQLLPYATIMYRGAPAEFDHLPLGTHLHGVFYLGPQGDFEVKPPDTDYQAARMANPDLRSVESKYCKVFRLEDDFSYFTRLGHGWKIMSIGEGLDSLDVQRVDLSDGSPVTEKDVTDGIKLRQQWRMDEGCSVWKGKEIASLADLAVGQVIQANLTWVGLLGNQNAMCKEIWIDDVSRRVATERQRQKYLADIKRRGVPARVIKTEHIPGQGAKGYVELAFYQGIDPELVEAFDPKKGAQASTVNASLRHYGGNVGSGSLGEISIRRIDNPPHGHSGIEMRAICSEMLEGFRAGRSVRVFSNDWPRLSLPLEEILHPNDSRIFSIDPNGVAGRGPAGDSSK